MDKAWHNTKLSGTSWQTYRRFSRTPGQHIIAQDASGNVLGGVYFVTGHISSLEDVPRTYRQVTGRMIGMKPSMNDNTVYCVSVGSDPDAPFKHVGIALVGRAVLRAYAQGYPYIFAYSRAGDYKEKKKADPSLTLQKHVDAGNDFTLHKFHGREYTFKPKGSVVKVLGGSRDNVLVQYDRDAIESWILANHKNQKVAQWLKEEAIGVFNGAVRKVG